MRATAIGIMMTVSAGEPALRCHRYRPGYTAVPIVSADGAMQL